MATVAETKKNVADWLKWGVGISWLLLAAVSGHAISTEHRLTALESWKDTHTTAAAKTEAELRAQLVQQSNDGKQILTAITAVQVEVAKINGYLESRKAADKQ